MADEEKLTRTFNISESEQIQDDIILLGIQEDQAKLFTKSQQKSVKSSRKHFKTASGHYKKFLIHEKSLEFQVQSKLSTLESNSHSCLFLEISHQGKSLSDLSHQEKLSKSHQKKEKEQAKNHLTSMTKEELSHKLFKKITLKNEESAKKSLKSNEDFIFNLLKKEKVQENNVVKIMQKQENETRQYLRLQFKQQGVNIRKMTKELELTNKFGRKLNECVDDQVYYMEKEDKNSSKVEKERIAQEIQAKRKKEDEDKYFATLRKVELQNIAAKQRINRQRTMRIERLNSMREVEVVKKNEVDLEESPESRQSIESSFIEGMDEEEVLKAESKIIESMVLICGSYFCSQCYRMLKRSSLFLKCGKCCPTSFKKKVEPSGSYTRQIIPEGAICVGCENKIVKGELVQCICCYIRQEFLKDYTPNTCSGCCSPESVSWVDTYTGSKYEMINCGFCERRVNYLYVVEICLSCHDQVCLHCLRKNNFLSISVCSECHSRRQVNPYRSLQKRLSFS